MKTLLRVVLWAAAIYLAIGLLISIQTTVTREMPPEALGKPAGFLAWFVIPIFFWVFNIHGRTGVSEFLLLACVVALGALFSLIQASRSGRVVH